MVFLKTISTCRAAGSQERYRGNLHTTHLFRRVTHRHNSVSVPYSALLSFLPPLPPPIIEAAHLDSHYYLRNRSGFNGIANPNQFYIIRYPIDLRVHDTLSINFSPRMHYCYPMHYIIATYPLHVAQSAFADLQFNKRVVNYRVIALRELFERQEEADRNVRKGKQLQRFVFYHLRAIVGNYISRIVRKFVPGSILSERKSAPRLIILERVRELDERKGKSSKPRDTPPLPTSSLCRPIPCRCLSRRGSRSPHKRRTAPACA